MKKILIPAAMAAVVACVSAVAPAQVSAKTLKGKVTEPNFVQKRFWITPGNRHIAVFAGNAQFFFHGHHANVYRMMGTPWVKVTGNTGSRLFYATRVDILTAPTVPLERSSFTNRARPRFTDRDLEGTYGR
ncbi:MAG: hypothetical protein M3Y56_02615 [Armatimonadota bacterium]|nr:hypothetical protein [Armatimonadota bacterium]